MNTKHTPGPWVLEPLRGKYCGSVVRIGAGSVNVWQPMGSDYEASEREVAYGWIPEYGFDHVETQESYATALLIAAAPELLDAIYRLLDAADDSDGAQYGTLSTTFVRQIASAAIAKAEGRA